MALINTMTIANMIAAKKHIMNDILNNVVSVSFADSALSVDAPNTINSTPEKAISIASISTLLIVSPRIRYANIRTKNGYKFYMVYTIPKARYLTEKNIKP